MQVNAKKTYKCLFCEAEFIKFGRRQYCSDRCQALSYNERRFPGIERLAYCKNCGVKLQGKHRQICSSKCSNKLKQKIASTSPNLFLEHLVTKERREKYGLTWRDLNSLYEKQKGLCAITKLPMTFDRTNGKKYTNISLDRIDSSLGYVADNMHLVCYIVNVMKFTLSLDELKEWCHNILKGLNK